MNTARGIRRRHDLHVAQFLKQIVPKGRARVLERLPFVQGRRCSVRGERVEVAEHEQTQGFVELETRSEGSVSVERSVAKTPPSRQGSEAATTDLRCEPPKPVDPVLNLLA